MLKRYCVCMLIKWIRTMVEYLGHEDKMEKRYR